jgi:hypothetical protein
VSEVSAESVEAIARVAHETNRAYCEAMDEPNVSERWHRASEEQRASSREGVRKALDGATPEELHRSWADAKLLRGWRYGEVKSEETREHPCLLPYDRLPEAQRRKDALFAAVVSALA